jgi:hypothetical protein
MRDTNMRRRSCLIVFVFTFKLILITHGFPEATPNPVEMDIEDSSRLASRQIVRGDNHRNYQPIR